MSNTTAHITTTCYHCGDSCNDTHLRIDEKAFCCAGCKLVYEILNENNLCAYYDLNVHPGSQQLQQRRKNKFAYLDKEEITGRLVSFSDGQQSHITFQVPQIHCSSCLWLLEHLDQLQPGILSARVNFVKKEVFVIFDNLKTTLREVVETMNAIGYEPYLSLSATQSGRKISYSRVTQISIAGFCFANIMMLSLPEYFSVTNYLQEKTGTAFRYIALLLSLPVFFYCSREFFSNAYSSIKTRYLNIDSSIALAILLTFGRSLYNLLVLDGNTYFDSMSGIVFFMLVGRWAQDRTQQSLIFDRDYRSFFPIAVNVKRTNGFEPIMIHELKEKDIIEVFDQEIIPADAVLAKGKALIDYSFVTGESLPKPIEPGSLIYAGGKQLGERIELMVLKKSDQGYLTNLWNKEGKRDPAANSNLHRISNYFTLVVFALTLASAVFWLTQGAYTTMWNALTTTLIVACPCALLLASTFTNGNVMRILSRSGIFLRNSDVITDMSGITHVVLDKTGTITINKNFRINYNGKVLTEEDKELTASLCRHSTHPLSKAVYNHLKTKTLHPVDSFINVPGKGIEGWINDRHIKIGNKIFVQPGAIDSDTINTSKVFVWIDGVIPGVFELENIYRPGLTTLLKDLRKKFQLSILSGDNSAESARLRAMTGGSREIYFNQSPEDKYNYITALQTNGAKVLMAGDGLNDAGALRKSDVGIAVMEGSNSFTPASDAIISGTALPQLTGILAFVQKAKRIILVSFTVSIFYNIIGLYFALQGLLAPVIAAILMPASTISIILITFLLSEWYGRKLLRL
ncbi:heavy metal translocating P-type ATPase [Niabella sp. CJ426]|uniref:heavy metal translocating P-type ATPase n=1 Tax=Niabella sp. CJ426 TaxID=3393740 RepID=UPI003D022C6E